MSTEDPALQTQDSADAVERALRAGLEDFELSDEDRALLERGDAALDAEADPRPAAGRGRRRPPERRQVDAGQPDHRPPRGRRRGRARGHPRPRRLRRRVGRPPVHPRRHRRLGHRRHRHPPAGRRAGRDRRRPRRRRAVRRRRHRRRHRRRRELRQAAAPRRQAGRAHRQQGRRPAHRGRRRGAVEPRARPAVARSRRCTGGGAATSSTPCSRCCPRSPRWAAPTSAAARAGSRCSAARTSASPRCSTSSSATSGSSSTASPARPATPSTSWSSSAARRGASSTPPASGAACTRPAGSDFYASLRTQTALEKAEVAVVLVDASEPITEQDVRVIQQVIDAGRALVIAYNKWDLIDEERRHFLEREIERDLVQIPWAPRVNVSARTGRHMDRLVPALETRARLVGHAHLHRSAERLPRRGRRGAPAPGARRQAAPHPLRDPGRHPTRRGSCCSRRGSSRPATGGSSSAACARSSASSAPRSRSRCGCARSAPAAESGRMP